ncbi:MarR family winged helix-turn-helix transcriptional regulator [Ramlibacter albus]|uniref:MarR family transcriptional regulator n=1 Tax=Ramlibacter albus TaxID=2079448 RepID=A0A923M8P9_9BURK|nr:MarR family transcriptional regulator [Ramlibacter albus]MBC5765430.1 MarR family transcriptional regulator [Ramlibacter albus]
MPRPTEPLKQEELRRHAGYLLALTRFQAFRNFARHIGGPYELRPVEYSILILLDTNENVAQNQLAQTLGVAAPNMTGILHRLEGRGLVERVRAETDRRVQFIELTAKGRKVVREAAAVSKTMDKEWLARLSRAEQAMLMELLAKLAGVPA